LPLIREALSVDRRNQEALYWFVANGWGYRDEGGEVIEAAEEYLRLSGYTADIHRYVAFHHHVFDDMELARDHYEAAMGLGGSAGAASAGDLEALLFGGMLFDQLGDATGAQEAWQRGKEIAEQARQLAPDNPHLGLMLASFHAVLGEDASAAALEDEFLILPSISAWDLNILATARARQGDTVRAAELLQRTILVAPMRGGEFFKMAGVSLDNEDFEQVLAEMATEHQRLVEAYGPGAAAGRRP